MLPGLEARFGFVNLSQECRHCDLVFVDEVVIAQHAAMLADPASAGQYGLGVVILPASVTLGGGRALGHDGGIDGFHTQMFWFEAKKTAVAMQWATHRPDRAMAHRSMRSHLSPCVCTASPCLLPGLCHSHPKVTI